MKLAFDQIYDGLASVPVAEPDRITYSVASVPARPDCFIGRDSHDHACILIAIADHDTRHHAPIRLESLEVQFDVRSLIKRKGQFTESTFTVIRCRSLERELIRYFFSIGETILRILGSSPSCNAIAHAINRLALIFQRLQNPPARPVNGLFGELFLIRCCRNPLRALAAWRPKDSSRFDFSDGYLRLDVKTASGRLRTHTFSYDQCNPPLGTVAIVASLFVERTASGVCLRELIRTIETLVAEDSDLVMKLHDTVSETLGNGLQEALGIRFDESLAASSLKYYDLRSIPAIRCDIPGGVSEVHFRSDLSGMSATLAATLIKSEPAMLDFLRA